MGDGRGRWGRRGEPTSLARLVGRHANTVAQRWRAVAGDTLVAQTWCLGVRDGVLRIIAGNEAIRQEVLGRTAHVVAAWNLAAGEERSEPASDLACWVGSGSTGRVRRSRPDPVRPPCEPADRARASAEMAEVQAPEVRAALIEARSRAIAQAREGSGDV